MNRRWPLFLVVAVLAPVSARAQTSYPMLTHVMPVAVQRGKTTEVTVEGRMGLAGVYKVLFDRPGLTAKVLATKVIAPKGKLAATISSVKLLLAVEANAPLGIREFRVATPTGVSSVGQLVIVDDPVILESGPNNTPKLANPIKLPCVICGRIEAAEDLDYFRFEARAGENCCFEVLCARLEDKIHDLQKHADPLLTLLDAQGRELAANDDYYFADPLLRFTASRSGTYFLQIRDSKYDGDPRWVYAIRATNRPYVTGVYPPAGNPGQTIEVEPLGLGATGPKRVVLTAPPDLGLTELSLEVDGTQTNAVPFIVSSLPLVGEIEPNDTPAQAQRVTLPCGIYGRIGTRGDVDHFVFAAPKGKPIRFEVKARRFGTPLCSPLDSMLEILNAMGQVVASNDDAYGKDSALIFSAPATGDYVLRIRDLNHKGGPAAVYFIEVEYAQPDFRLRCDPDKAMIGPGASTAWYVHIERRNGFVGAVRVEIEGLPPGVAASPLTIPPTMTQGVSVLSAAPDAPRDAVNVRVRGTEEPTKPIHQAERMQRLATANEEIYLPGGGRGVFAVNEQTVAVTTPSDIQAVAVTPTVLTLQPGEEKRIDITVNRRPDFTKDITLDILMRHLGRVYGNPLPPGVTVVESKSKTLLGGGSKGHIVLKAAPNAMPIDGVPISVQAYVSINFVVKMGYSSLPIRLSIKKPETASRK